MLYIISTPIGNLSDITYRAVETLKEVDLIIAEDTRRAGKLLKHYDIKTKAISFHEHSSTKKEDAILNMLEEKKSIAMISDAGTPLISDPGYTLVKKCFEKNIQTIPIPGASAPIAALVASGCTTNQFTFYGFLSKKKNERRKIFENIKENNTTSIFYESPYRIINTLEILNEVMPDRYVCIAREITKRHEEFVKGKINKIISKVKPKGEFTIVIEKKQRR